jgi:hypothetical protein
MTPEERERMNVLCLGIQEEKDFDKFAAMLSELSELIDRKQRRRFRQHPRLVWHRDRPFRTLPAVVNKLLKPAFAEQPEKVEIAIKAADELFREVRIENALTSPEGETVALKPGAHIDVTFEADSKDCEALRSPRAVKSRL